MHTPVSDSDATSIVTPTASSPKAYYVQSPSHDSSHDDPDKYCSSSNGRSPLDSPFFHHHSLGSSSYTAASRVSGNRRRWNKHYCNVVDEEKADDEDYYLDDVKCTKGTILCLALGLVFGAISFVLWCASRPYNAQVNVKALKVHSFHYGEGLDRTGVPTKLITVNCSAHIIVSNPATFFSVHVSFHTASLLFSEITVATGQLKKYYQPKKSKRTMQMSLVGQEVPLYGTGMALASFDDNGGIPFKLELEVHSRGDLVGKLVKTKHARHVLCQLVIDSKHTKEVLFEHDSCN